MGIIKVEHGNYRVKTGFEIISEEIDELKLRVSKLEKRKRQGWKRKGRMKGGRNEQRR